MSTKIIFSVNNFFLNYGLAYTLQNKSDFEFYALFDVTNNPKKFFQEQKLVNFKKFWFFHDHLQNTKHEPDVNYLIEFEKKYSINLWQLGFNERLFYFYNDLYKFSQNEILSILEKECKLYEKILDEINPDFLIIHETALHHQQLLLELCKNKGIKILMLNQSKLGYKCIISQELHKIDFMPSLESIKSKGRSFDELLNYLSSFSSKKQTKFYTENFGKSKSDKVLALLKFLFSTNTNMKTNFSYYGRTKTKVLLNYFSLFLKTKIRKLFLDKNSEFEIHKNEKYVLFTLNQEPERSTLIATPFYTNQLEVIRHIAKSIPVGYKLYVKEHFSQSLREWRPISYYKEVIDIPNVRLFHPLSDTEKLIENSSLVISIGGTPPFQAAFYQKPSIVFADLGYSILPSIQKLDSLEDLPQIIRLSLNVKVNSNDVDRYCSILDNNSFDFDLMGYVIAENNFFKYGGNLLDVPIPISKMKFFLQQHENSLEMLACQYLDKIKKFSE